MTIRCILALSLLLLASCTNPSKKNTVAGKEQKIIYKHKAEVWGFLSAKDNSAKDTSAKDKNKYTPNYQLFSSVVFDSEHKEVFQKAKAAGCRLILQADSAQITKILLQNPKIRTDFIQTLVKTARAMHMDGIHIKFGGTSISYRQQLTAFMAALSKACKEEANTLQLSLTVPGTDAESPYDLIALSNFTDRFILDFTHTPRDKEVYIFKHIIPMYLSSKLPAPRFIVQLPINSVSVKMINQVGLGGIALPERYADPKHKLFTNMLADEFIVADTVGIE
ncbi:MAG: hypothetical protein V4687_01270 [Bacteroidota bacterium]